MGKGGGAGVAVQRLRALAMQAGGLDFPRNPVKSWRVTELPVIKVLGVGDGAWGMQGGGVGWWDGRWGMGVGDEG